MKRISHLIAAIGLVLSVTACGPASTPPPSTPSAVIPAISSNPLVDQIVLQGNRDLTLAAIGYDSVAKTATVLVVQGVIRGSALDTLQDLNHKATELLQTGYRASDTVEKARAAASLRGVIGQIKLLIR